MISIINRDKALNLIGKILQNLNVPKFIIKIAERKSTLKPMPPPGLNKVVQSRNEI